MKTANTSIEELLVTREFLADPYPLLHRLREEEPVYWSDAIGGWILTAYDDVVVSFKDTAHFSNENRLGKAVEYLSPEKRANFKAFEEHFSHKSLIHSDPPDHNRMRALVVKEFTPKVVEQIKPKIQETVDRLIDAAQSRGQIDVVSELAAPLPIGIIAEILGVPECDRHLFQVWANDLLAFQGVNKPSEKDLLRAQNAIVQMRPYIRNMLEERRRQPREDLISKFVAAESDGGRIAEPELVSSCVTLFIAGQETSISFIANSLLLLLAHPDQLELLRSSPALLTSALEESLRYESPVPRQPRIVKEDFELRGKKLKKGEIVFQMLNAANRDPAWFPDPDKFDIRRKNNRHMAFGQGIHFCVGAVLARAEGFITIGTAIRHLPNLHMIDKTPDWDLDKRNSRVLRTLKVQL